MTLAWCGIQQKWNTRRPTKETNLYQMTKRVIGHSHLVHWYLPFWHSAVPLLWILLDMFHLPLLVRFLMGLVFSSLPAKWNGSTIAPAKPTLGDFPEICVALILEYMDPPQIWKLAKLTWAFCGASWVAFWNCHQIVMFSIVRKILEDFLNNLG